MYNVYIYIVNSKQLIKRLKKAGWTLARVKGSHNHFIHPDYGHVVTVPHQKKDLATPLVKAILKQAHIE